MHLWDKVELNISFSDLHTLKSFMEEFKTTYLHMMHDRDIATKFANETLSMPKQLREEVSELTMELNSTKLALENVQEALLEANDQLYETQQLKEREGRKRAKEINQVMKELDFIQEEYDLAHCPKKSENKSSDQQED